MPLTYSITDDFKVIIKNGSKKIDEVGAFDSKEGAELWGQAVVEKYNAPEYSKVKYPEELPVE